MALIKGETHPRYSTWKHYICDVCQFRFWSSDEFKKGEQTLCLDCGDQPVHDYRSWVAARRSDMQYNGDYSFGACNENDAERDE